MANEPDPECTPVKPVMKKFMYKSPLSGIRSTPYKPPVDKSGFEPIGVSSPKFPNNVSGDKFALAGDGPQSGRPPNLENDQRLDIKPRLRLGQGDDCSVTQASLGGRGGHWRGPQDMSPESRRGGRRRGYQSSPANEGGPRRQWYSPIPNLDGYSGGNDSSGRNSFRQDNFGNNSFGSNPHSPITYSPRGDFNSSGRSRNSPRNNSRRGNRGGSHGSGDITLFYSPWMNRDPWSDLMSQKMNASSFQSKTLNKDSFSLMNLTSDGEVDEGTPSQERDTPLEKDCSSDFKP